MRQIILGAVATLCLAPPATAATIQHDVEFETWGSGGPSQPAYYRFELPRFNVSLGTLTRVELFWTADVYLNLKWTTTTNPLSDVYGVWLPIQEVAVIVEPNSPYPGLFIWPTDAVVVGKGPSGEQGELTGETTASGYAINDAFSQDLSAYWSGDRIELVYGEQLWGLAEAGGDMDLIVTALAKHSFTYVYTYLPGVPEPATWALLTLGFGVAGASLRRYPRRETRQQRSQDLVRSNPVAPGRL